MYDSFILSNRLGIVTAGGVCSSSVSVPTTSPTSVTSIRGTSRDLGTLAPPDHSVPCRTFPAQYTDEGVNAKLSARTVVAIREAATLHASHQVGGRDKD